MLAMLETMLHDDKLIIERLEVAGGRGRGPRGYAESALLCLNQLPDYQAHSRALLMVIGLVRDMLLHL